MLRAPVAVASQAACAHPRGPCSLSWLLAGGGELARSRGTEMRAAVATLQSEQDKLVRLDPRAKLVLRGGPGTGKTVVGLHRAAWLVYNDTRLTAGKILVIGPSDRFLRFVAAVLPTLGEARISQTTFDRLLGPTSDFV